MKPLLSLCIATNGISEWVFPVLESIYAQNISMNLFEVVVTDNGTDEQFTQKMREFQKNHENLVYAKTSAYLFENQIEALRLAKGEFLKFVNHRAVLESGALEWLLNCVRKNLEAKPVMYFSNGALKLKERWQGDFDGFVKNLREFASWTTGVGVWREDFEKIPHQHIYNRISPHSDVLFAERHKSSYIIDDSIWSNEIDTNHSKKGNYDLYKAFGVEELTITLGLYIDGDIKADTFKSVKKDYEQLLARFFLDFSILKRPCSYSLSGFDDAMGIFFSARKIREMSYLLLLKKITKKIFGIKRKNVIC